MLNIKDFLARIGLAGAEPACTPAFLAKVQEACVLSIPYENLDILAGKPLSLDVDDVYKKVVGSHRGGYCFELNALLHYILTDMGFAVRSCFARVLREEPEVPFRRHRILIVSLDGCEYLVDIGFGNTAPRLPLKLVCSEVQEQNGESYRFEKDENLGWVIWELHKGQWRKYISFTTEHQYDIDFAPTSFWCEKHPDSPFNKAEMVAIKVPGGRKALNGRDYKVFADGELVSIEENVSDARLSEILDTEFGLRGF